MAMWAFSVQWFFQVQCFLSIIGSVTLQVVLSRWQVWWLELTQLVRLGNETKNILNLAAVETIESPALPVNHFIVLCTQSQLEHMQWIQVILQTSLHFLTVFYTWAIRNVWERISPLPCFSKSPCWTPWWNWNNNKHPETTLCGWMKVLRTLHTTESTYSTNFS